MEEWAEIAHDLFTSIQISPTQSWIYTLPAFEQDLKFVPNSWEEQTWIEAAAGVFQFGKQSKSDGKNSDLGFEEFDFEGHP